MTELLLILGGTLIGALGNLTGIGGGFLLMPLLLWLTPNSSAAVLASITMVVVLFNSLAGSLPPALHRRIPWKTALPMAIAAIPLVALGSLVQGGLPIALFRKLFGGFMLATSALLGILAARGLDEGTAAKPGSPRWISGLLLSLPISFSAGLLGVGGGFLMVPLLVHWLKIPLRRATASSQVILVAVSLCSLSLALAQGNFRFESQTMPWLVLGVLGGTQLGHALSRRLPTKLVLLILLGLILLTGMRLILT